MDVSHPSRLPRKSSRSNTSITWFIWNHAIRRIDRSEQDINTIGVQKTAPGIAHMQRLGLSFIFQTFVLSSRQLNNRGFSLIILNHFDSSS